MNYPFKIEVIVYRRPNLRDENLEYERFLGRNVLDDMYTNLKVRPDVTDLFLSFPEQWLNIIEQRVLYDRCEHYLPNLKNLRIKTHSVYIIQCTPNKSCKVVQDPHIIETSDSTVRLYNENSGNVFDVSKINVI